MSIEIEMTRDAVHRASELDRAAKALDLHLRLAKVRIATTPAKGVAMVEVPGCLRLVAVAWHRIPRRWEVHAAPGDLHRTQVGELSVTVASWGAP